ncbi:HoxN/HupN/NixA family nickel/cobalt transporter [Myceligenerans pegani]|uniref:Nickel/cobalt efflux system n=1 Tax=Myceligenerans pegani TaxID=2776917 RepID=A0ABR9N1X2_9MICO|nr:high-affinity nickel-transport protein [Myceligenerans sp. TRM 65318]MBE1877271.1 high-affinity nickel-transport protein [Myceligenerans sp. TRM 65318]MBE3019542.1 high-affinity nickel-transport protein [Myceligenerans sp. TRM 65318]
MTSSTPVGPHPARSARSGRRGRRGATVPVIIALHVVGVGGLAGALALDGGAGAITLAMGLAAYALGLRHAFDADHIATIDNTTRKLVRAGRDARGVGLWFSLGHSTVVLGAALLLSLGVGALAPMLGDESSPLRSATGVWGPLVSGTFLLAIAAVNLVMLRRALRARTAAAAGDQTDAGHATGGPRAGEPGPGSDTHHAGGPVTWALRRFGWATDKPSRMYAVGLVFGLGFDTATEIGLLAITASAALGQVAWYAALPLAVLFAAGMSMLDSAQGAVARRVYAHAGSGGPEAAGVGGRPAAGQSGMQPAGGGSSTQPAGVVGGRPGAAPRPGVSARTRVRYDVVVTGISALAALGIGAVTLVQVAAEHAPWLGRFPVAALSLEPYGVVLTVVLLAAWGTGLLLALRQPRREA